jgi:NADPH-dependent 2,4-dienoyl-CoA reductase/sulfur reductase-like enzyme
LPRVCIVGASLGGLRAAEALRHHAFEGTITLIGAEDHLPYDRPPLSKQVLAGTWEADRVPLRPTDTYGDLDLDLRLGTVATGLDLHRREVALTDGDTVPFDSLVLACGAIPRTLPRTESLAGVHVLRTLDDSLALRAELEQGPRLVVIGAGFIGAEVAATARRRGLEVTIVEALPAPLVRGLGPQMGMACAALHQHEGVDIRLGVGVSHLDGDGAGRVARVHLVDGTAIEADVVVVGIGVRPATDWLEGSGLEIRDGIVCDDRCAAVGAEAVYAVGDVARWPNPLFDEEMRLEHWTNAAEQADAAVRNLLGLESAEPYAPVPFFWSDQYDAKIQFVGRSSADDEVRVVHSADDGRKIVALYGRAGRLVGCLGFSMPRLVMQYRRLIAERASWDEALAHAPG